jgi:hypothetical protein
MDSVLRWAMSDDFRAVNSEFSVVKDYDFLVSMSRVAIAKKPA